MFGQWTMLEAVHFIIHKLVNREYKWKLMSVLKTTPRIFVFCFLAGEIETGQVIMLSDTILAVYRVWRVCCQARQTFSVLLMSGGCAVLFIFILDGFR